MELMLSAGTITLGAVSLAIINQRFFKLPTTVAVMLASAVLSLIITISGKFYLHNLDTYLKNTIDTLDFNKILLEGMLGYLLFAGALNIRVNEFKTAIKEIISLATISTILSTLIIAFVLYQAAQAPILNLHISWHGCLLFAALISPTDPIAVLGTLKQMKAPKAISIRLAGESLFNDGVGIVIFITIYKLSYEQNTAITISGSLWLFCRQALGGLIYGAILGILMRKILTITNGVKLHILSTIAIVTLGYTLAEKLMISGALAMVVAGMMLNYTNNNYRPSAQSQTQLKQFWEIIDELLNVVLFFLLGAELIIIDSSSNELILMILIIPTVLIARLISIYIPITLTRNNKKQPANILKILTWGGLRGGLAVALALALPKGYDRHIILCLTYAVVFFSIIIQGTTIKHLIPNK